MPQGKFSKQEAAPALQAIRLTLLRQDAEQAAERRGHTLKGWHYHSQGTSAATDCIRCQAYVYIKLKPQPNEVDIGGTAIAINCKVGFTPNACTSCGGVRGHIGQCASDALYGN
jgi:hypothetical protein